MTALIECQQLSKRFAAQTALDQLSFELHSQQPVALIGPNGAGKSTLFSIICGYQFADSGTIRVMGHTPGAAALRGQIGALPQDALFDPDLPLLQQLQFLARLQGFSRAPALTEAQRVCELMGLADKHKVLPSQLSHGMKKRLSIAQALIGSPKLVLLDEPTAGLDPENALNIRRRIEQLADDTRFIISSHNLSELEKLCSQVLFLNQGRLQLQQNLQQQYSDLLTLQLWQSHAQLPDAIRQLSGVRQVKQHREQLQIDYDQQHNPVLDQQLLQLLAGLDIRYRQLSHGQSLEQQLFDLG